MSINDWSYGDAHDSRFRSTAACRTTPTPSAPWTTRLCILEAAMSSTLFLRLQAYNLLLANAGYFSYLRGRCAPLMQRVGSSGSADCSQEVRWRTHMHRLWLFPLSYKVTVFARWLFTSWGPAPARCSCSISSKARKRPPLVSTMVHDAVSFCIFLIYLFKIGVSRTRMFWNQNCG
jgi:hypothetical protein